MIKMNNWLLLSIATLLLWGLWGFFIKLASNHLDQKSVIVWQAIGTTAVLLGILIAVKFHPAWNANGFWFAIIAGAATALGGVCFMYALNNEKAAIIVPLTALYPIVTILLAFFFLKEPISLNEGIGIVLALAAMVLFSL